MRLASLDGMAVFVFGTGSTMRKLVFCLQWGLPIYGGLPVFVYPVISSILLSFPPFLGVRW